MERGRGRGEGGRREDRRGGGGEGRGEGGRTERVVCSINTEHMASSSSCLYTSVVKICSYHVIT